MKTLNLTFSEAELSDLDDILYLRKMAIVDMLSDPNIPQARERKLRNELEVCKKIIEHLYEG